MRLQSDSPEAGERWGFESGSRHPAKTPGAVRNLDEIQEAEPQPRSGRLGALVLAAVGGACIVVAAVALLRTPPRARPQIADPLGDLVAKSRPAGEEATGAERRSGGPMDISFPGLLSDRKRTTALEAVRDAPPAGHGAEGREAGPGAHGAPGSVAASPYPPGMPTAPPPAADRLPVVPLPAQHVLQPPTSPAAPDVLGAMARHASREEESGDLAPSGTPGGFQLQVSSFKTQEEADSFSLALRRRGHKAYVEPAQVKGRGLWYRVRIGPFKYKRSAVLYRQDFEAKERLVTFIVEPPKTKVMVGDDKDD